MLALASIMVSVAVVLIVVPVLQLIIPNFKKQKELANIASWLNKSDVELNQLNHGVLVRAFSQKILPLIDEKWSIDRIFGKKLHEKYVSLGKKESYIEYLAILLVKSLIMVPPIILLSIVLKNSLVLLLAPISIVALFIGYVNQINTLHKTRQSLLIRDLPNLISKMMIALETGNSFTDIFKMVAKDSSPLLSDMIKRLIANEQIMPMRDALRIFAQEVDLPVMYDFVSVVNVGLEKGYKDAIQDFESIKNDLRELRRLSLIEQTKGNPQKMNLFYMFLFAHIIILLIATISQLFAVMNRL
ncbi:hypothetical protein [Paenibacillus alvei]|uniref:hypothetical protein n=1 Tax=Paenibacillus alvei TaxID=44250 RepID=UPI00227E15ED|nr:hypothetical protein [Paenibacillus alvei]